MQELTKQQKEFETKRKSGNFEKRKFRGKQFEQV